MKWTDWDDAPTEKKQFQVLINDLTEILNNKERHLSDVASGIRFTTSKLETLYKEIFIRHKDAKNSQQ